MDKPELVGADFDFKIDGGKVIMTVNHVGAHGYAKLEAGANAKPFLDKAIDEIEKVIPGDQVELAQKLKAVLAMVNF